MLADIKVIGCGGGGVNAVNRMVDMGLSGVEFVALNTDAQALITSPANIKLDIGRNVTKGLGAGADPEQGRLAAEENVDDIKEDIKTISGYLDGEGYEYKTFGYQKSDFSSDDPDFGLVSDAGDVLNSVGLETNYLSLLYKKEIRGLN